MRVKRGTVSKRKHKKLLKSVKGFRMSKRRLVKSASEASLHAGQYSYQGRKKRKSQTRTDWIRTISEHLKEKGYSYSKFISAINKKKIKLDRKVMSYLIKNDPQTFEAVIKESTVEKK